MIEKTNPALVQAADFLFNAWIHAAVISDLSEKLRPDSIEQSYVLQD